MGRRVGWVQVLVVRKEGKEVCVRLTVLYCCFTVDFDINVKATRTHDSQDASPLPPRGRLEAYGQLPLLDFLFKPGLTTARHALHKEAERAPDDGGSEEDTDGRHYLWQR